MKVQWVNFHKEPKGCPMDVLKMEDTRVTHWSRCLALRVGRFDEDIGDDEDAQKVAEGLMWGETADNRAAPMANSIKSTVGTECAKPAGGCRSRSDGCFTREDRHAPRA